MEEISLSDIVTIDLIKKTGRVVYLDKDTDCYFISTLHEDGSFDDAYVYKSSELTLVERSKD
jgi:hypothetical protein